MASSYTEHQFNNNLHNSENIPAWKLPLNKPYTSGHVVRDRLRNEDERSTGTATSGFSSMSGSSGISSMNSGEFQDESYSGDDSQIPQTTVIQILLPCLICNRRFSPEALERHSKICTRVNVKPKFSPTRGKFDSASMRIKHTPLELFIPPPPDNPPEPPGCESPFTRGGKGRHSIGGIGSGSKVSSRATTPATVRKASTPSRELYYDDFDDHSEESYAPYINPPTTNANSINHHNHNQRRAESLAGSVVGGDSLPSYARPLTHTETCPYCGRNFVPKAYDRHFKFCEEIFLRKQYEIQPTTKEKELATQRQEIRTKYKPMKGSSSYSSLRSMSPCRNDFTNFAMRFFNGFRGGAGGKEGFKKSNESLTANSCYGDFTRNNHGGGNSRLASPAPSSIIQKPSKPKSMLPIPTSPLSRGPSKIPTSPFLRSYSFSAATPTYTGQGHGRNYNRPTMPMQLNTSGNISNCSGSAKNSTENLANYKKNYAHVQSSGYGQDPFNRNSKIRSSLGKNFFRSSKRVEPEGTENTNGVSYHNNNHQQNSLYSNSNGNDMSVGTYRSRNPEIDYESRMDTNEKKSHQLFDPTYDPYERAAKQLEELLKTQPIKTTSNKNASRKIGLDRMMQSISSPMADTENDTENDIKSTSQLNSLANKHSLSSSDSYTKNRNPFLFPTTNHTSTSSPSYSTNSMIGASDNYSSSISNGHGDLSSTWTSKKNPPPQPPPRQNKPNSTTSYLSRLDGRDKEFEALEKFVNLGKDPENDPTESKEFAAAEESFLNSKAQIALEKIREKHNDSNSSSSKGNQSKNIYSESPLEKLRRSFSNNNTYNNNNSTSLNAEIPMDTSSPSQTPPPPPPVASSSITIPIKVSYSNPNPNPNPTQNSNIGPAKFCHECGCPYPTILSRFCPECGERRSINV